MRIFGAFHIAIACMFCLFLCSCRGAKTLSETGLKFARLGYEMPPAGMGRLKGHMQRDTLCSENDFQWRAAILKYPQGNVWIEEDFFGGNIINRIRVETPEIRLRNGMRVGITVARLRESLSEWYVNPMPLYQKFDFYTTLLPGIHFVVEDPSVGMGSEHYEDYPISTFNPAARVVAIVVY